MEREAYLYRTIKEKGEAECLTCQRKCIIEEGKRGWCQTRVNKGGRIYSIIYGEVSSLSINPIEKKPVFHFYPGSKWFSLGSLGCNFRCPGCQNWGIAHWRKGAMHSEYLPPEETVARAKGAGCIGISWTFNEPTLWFEYTLDSAKCARSQGLFTNYVTNGYMTEEALDAIGPFLDVYRVDIKGFSEKTYQRIGHIRDYQKILETTKKAKEYGIHVEVVTNVIPGFNDSEEELQGIASWIKNTLGPETPWHVTRFYPDLQLSNLPLTPIDVLEGAWSIGNEAGLWYVYVGNIPGHKRENTYCHVCGELLIERYVFDIVTNKIKGGKCFHCGTAIAGRFFNV
jgi:pyruvate formate lyase activating enzyme